MVVSSVSPERCETTAVKAARFAISMASSVSVKRANLVELDKDRIGRTFLDATLEARGICDKQVIANQLYAVAESLRVSASNLPSRLRSDHPQ